MSFILDALKKAEPERGRVPTLATVHGPVRQSARAAGLWVAAGVLLVGGGLSIWFLWPSPHAVPPAATDFQTRVSTTPPAGKTVPERKILSAEPGGGQALVPAPRAPLRPDIAQGQEGPRKLERAPLVNPPSILAPPSPPSVVRGLPRGAESATPLDRRWSESGPIEAPRVEPPPVREKRAARTPVEPSPPSPAKPSPGADQTRTDVMAPSLPSSPPKLSTFREALAKMTVDVFVYTSVKADRMVVISGRRYVEGQYVDGLYLLEDITPEGVVLSYQGEHALLRP